MTAATTFPTLAATLWPSAGRARGAARALALAFVGSVLMVISAKVQIPFWPVPMTMQTFVVLVIGMAYGPRLGAATMLLYLAQGAAGLPVFAGTPERGLGLAYMVGPTGGYLAGFVVAAWLCGVLAERGWDRSVGRVAAAMVLGHAVILALGVAWLAGIVGWERAVAVGLAPFWAATVAKTLLAMAVLPLAWRALGGRPRA